MKTTFTGQSVDIVNATHCNCHYDDSGKMICANKLSTATYTYFYDLSVSPWQYLTSIAPHSEQQVPYQGGSLGVSYQHSDRPDNTSVIYSGIATHKGWVVNLDGQRNPNTPFVITYGSLNVSTCEFTEG